VEEDVKVKVSKYISYLLRHNPEDLVIDEEGFVVFDALFSKVRLRFPMVDKALVTEIVNKSERRRFEIRDEKIRALYGHTIKVSMKLQEDNQTRLLYHGTTPQAANEILEKGLQPMKRRWVHLSPTEEIAYEVGKRRTDSPVVLVIDASEARRHGLRFYKATDKVYVCKYVPAKYITRLHV
jgi:putative RNA 2'-phosphotransferase